MRRFSWFLVALLLPALALAGRGLRSVDRLVWLGLDYTQARFISTVDFQDEEQVVHYYPQEWNRLVVKELLPDLGKRLGVSVVADVGFMNERNQACSTEQIVRKDGGADRTHLDRDAVARVVASWTPDEREGYGVGIVVDRLVKLDEKGCGWIALVDLSDMSLVDTRRYCEDVGGFGFRNYYFNPFKVMVLKDLKKWWRSM